MQLTATLALCLAGLLAMAIPACAGTKARPPSFREESVEITSLPKDAVYYLSDVQGSPVVETDIAGQLLGAAAYQPYGGVRYQKGRQGDPWGFVGNEEDRGTGLSDFHARPYRPEVGIFTSVDSQALLQPEMIIGKLSRMFPYAYAAGDPIAQFDKDGKDYSVSIEGNHIEVTLPVAFYGKVTQQQVNSMKASFESVWNQSPHTYKWDPKGPSYDVTFKMQGSIAKGPFPEQPTPVGVNSISIVPGKYLDSPNGSKIGGAHCEHGAGCRTASFPSERLKNKTMVAHELGHLMELDHVEDERNLMFATTDGPDHKTVSQTQINVVINRAMFRKPREASVFKTMISPDPPARDVPK